MPEPARPARSEALTLLAALQREARFLDLVKQPLSEFSDEQIGAASRNVLADCRAVLDRFFQIQPLFDQVDPAPVTVTMPVCPVLKPMRAPLMPNVVRPAPSAISQELAALPPTVRSSDTASAATI